MMPGNVGEFPPPTGALGEKDYSNINAQLAELSRLRENILLAQSGGIDVDAHLRDCDYLCQEYQKRKAAYFKGRP